MWHANSQVSWCRIILTELGCSYLKILLWEGIVKPKIVMENNQYVLNVIATLSASIDPLIRAEKKEEVTIVVKKLLEFVGKLK